MGKSKSFFKIIEESTRALEKIAKSKPSLCAVLGSGLGGAHFEGAKNVLEIPYSKIPHIPVPSVAGHEGKMIFFTIGETKCVVLSGRVHLYEGWSAKMVTLTVRVLLNLGCKCFLLTNAAGAVNPSYRPGSLVLIKDHINLTGEDPTRPEEPHGNPVTFTNLTDLYDPDFRRIIKESAKQENIEITEGVYACLKGPCYETPAEIKMLEKIGADLVGMSTVLEAMAIRYGGGRVAAISCVTNLAAGVEGSKPSHEEVKEVASKTSEKLERLFKQVAKNFK